MKPILASLSDAYPTDLPVEIVAFCPQLPCTAVEVQADFHTARTLREQAWLDEAGFAHVRIALSTEGLHPIRLVTSGQGTLAETDVIVGPRGPAPLAAAMQSCRFDESGRSATVAMTAYYGRQLFRGKLEIEVRSAERAVHSQMLEVENGSVEAEIRLSPSSPTFLVLRTQITNQETTVLLPRATAAASEPLGLETPTRVVRGEPLSISVDHAGSGQRGLLVIADARCHGGMLDVAASDDDYRIVKKESRKAIDLRISTGKLPVRVQRGRTHVPVVRTIRLSGFHENVRLPYAFGVGTWRISLYIPDGKDYRVEHQFVEIRRADGLALNMPTYVAPGDQIEGHVVYDLPEGSGGKLSVRNGTLHDLDLPSDAVGEIGVMISGDESVSAILETDDNEIHKLNWHNPFPPDPQGPEMTIRFPVAGETLPIGDSVTLHLDPSSLISDVATSLLQYPHGCGEQTASKLGGVAYLRSLVDTGINSAPADQLNELIEAGIQRMALFEGRPGLFSLWEGEPPDSWITQIIYRNLLPLDGLPFPQGQKMLDRTRRALTDVAPPGRADFSILDAAALHVDSQTPQDRQRALDYVQDTAFLSGDCPYWNEFSLFGGKDLSTCIALRILYDHGVRSLDIPKRDGTANDAASTGWLQRLLVQLRLRRPRQYRGPTRCIEEPFWKGLEGLTSKMPEGRFYSTAATREFIGILSSLRGDWRPYSIRFRDEKEVVPVEERIQTEGRPFEIVEGRGIVSQEGPSREEAKRQSLRVSASLPGQIHHEDVFPIRVSYQHGDARVTTPVLQMALPAHLQPVDPNVISHGDDRHYEVAMGSQRKLELRMCATRRGTGKAEFRVSDMYVADLSGLATLNVKVN